MRREARGNPLQQGTLLPLPKPNALPIHFDAAGLKIQFALHQLQVCLGTDAGNNEICGDAASPARARHCERHVGRQLTPRRSKLLGAILQAKAFQLALVGVSDLARQTVHNLQMGETRRRDVRRHLTVRCGQGSVGASTLAPRDSKARW
jgi:hypothetical protein